jgi:hypothetical protein
VLTPVALGLAPTTNGAFAPFSKVVQVHAFPGAPVSKVIGAVCENANDEVNINKTM